jgi:SSS family solute:Na+ symporter
VLLLRGLILVFVLLSVVLAQQQWQLIVNLMALSWGVVAGCFLGPFVWGLFWRRVSAAAVWANFAFALVFMGGLGYYYAADKATAGYVPVLAALTMIASLVITPLVSLITPAPAAALVDKAFGPGGDAVDAPSDGATGGTMAAAEGHSA